MQTRLVLAAAAAFALAGAAHAQETPPQSAAETPSAAPLDDATFEARAERFDGKIDQMTHELETAVRAAGADQAAAMASADEILARYQPEFDSFAGDFQAFFDARIAASQDAEARAQLVAARDAAIPAIRAVPGQIRAGLEADFVARNASSASASASEAAPDAD